jgi:hypothetical protein
MEYILLFLDSSKELQPMAPTCAPIHICAPHDGMEEELAQPMKKGKDRQM